MNNRSRVKFFDESLPDHADPLPGESEQRSQNDNLGFELVVSEPPPPQVGDLCPQCGEAKLDYDGMLNLTCEKCKYTLAGSCT